MYLSTQKYDFNPEDFEPIPEVESTLTACAINIAPSGSVRLNDRLQREIRKHTDVFNLGFEINRKDKRILRLFISDEPNYTFKKDGAQHDIKLTQYLVDNGISLPARYIVHWDEAMNSWIAILNEEINPSALKDTLKNAQKKRKQQ